MLQPFDSELGDFVEEICADLCRFECAATAGCEPAQVSVEREVALGTTLSPTSGSRRQRARVLLAPQRTAVVQGVVRADNGALVPGTVIVVGGKQVATNSRAAFVVRMCGWGARSGRQRSRLRAEQARARPCERGGRTGDPHVAPWRRPADASAMIRRLVIILALALSVVSAAAEELQPNQTYAGGTRVEASSHGVSFVIPQGWTGRFGQEPKYQALLLGSNTIEGVGIAIIQTGPTAAQVAAGLNEPQDLGAGVLRPTGAPTIRGSRMGIRYENETHVGFALALVGPTRNSVIFFFTGPPTNEKTYLSLLGELGNSTNFLPPARATAPPAPAPAQPQPPASAGMDQEWSSLLNGQALNYFSSYRSGGGGGGMASHRVLHLCPNGSFLYSGDSSVTMNVPGASGSSAGRGGFAGRWHLESTTPTTAVLVLAVEGGQELRWQMKYDDNKTFVNGQRWLREPSKACR
jgi:hypothetical protein